MPVNTAQRVLQPDRGNSALHAAIRSATRALPDKTFRNRVGAFQAV